MSAYKEGGMIKIFDQPVYMTFGEIMDKFHPLSVVVANCEERYHATTAGYVMASETDPEEDYYELSDYMKTLKFKPEKYGKVSMIVTNYPNEGESVLAEFAEQDSIEAENKQSIISLFDM